MSKQADKTPSKHLILRGSTYYFRLVVPEPLRKLVRKSELQKSLKTSDYETALRLAAAEREKALATIREARDKVKSGSKSKVLSFDVGSRNSEKSQPQPLTVTSEKHAIQLARQWFLTLEKDGAKWWRKNRQALSPEDRDGILADFWLDEEDIEGGAGSRIPDRHEDGSHEVRLFLELRNLTLDERSEGFSILASLLPEARLEFVRRQRDRIMGKEARTYSLLFNDLTEITPDLAIREGMTVGQLVSKFTEEIKGSGRAPKTVAQYKGTGRLLNEIFGENRGTESIERADVEVFVKCLETIPSNMKKRYPKMSVQEAIAEANKRGDPAQLEMNSRRNRYFGAFMMFRYAVAIKAVEINPFDDEELKRRFIPNIKTNDEKDPVPFALHELQAIFCAPLYTGCIDDRRGYAKLSANIIRGGRFWVPLLALFHGMRENEICQLHTSNVKDWEGGLYLELRSGDGRRLKNRASRRTIPVHPEVFKFGFGEYVAARRKDERSPRLFPDLTRAATGSYSDNFSKWFASFLLKIFGKKIEATFHTFRHTFVSACRSVNISSERIDAICGWAGGGRQQRSYGVAAPVSALAEDINRVCFKGLDLSHLYLPQVQEVAITARTRVRPTKGSVSP